MRILALALAAATLACTTEVTPDELTVLNASEVPIVVFAVRDAHLVDPIAQLEPGTFEDAIIETGRQRQVDVPEGENIGLFIYAVRLSGVAVLARIQEAEHWQGMVPVRNIPGPPDAPTPERP